MLQQIANIANRCLFPVTPRVCSAGRPASRNGSRRHFVLIPILLAAFSIDCRMTEQNTTPSPKQQNTNKTAEVDSIHRRAIAVDMHADTPQRLLDEQVDLSQRLPDGHFDSV